MALICNNTLLIGFLWLWVFPLTGFATHIVGGELNYTYLGNDDYEIRLAVYFDCQNGNPTAISSDDVISIGIFDSANNFLDSLMIRGIGLDTLESTLSTNCITPPTNVCVAVNIYTDTINLPPLAGGYQLSFQRCCRNGALIQNIQAPGSTGATYYATIPDAGIATDNSNPVFTNWPPIYVCQNLQLRFDHIASDPDADSLVYELCTPFEGATQGFPKPEPPNDPPYGPVVFINPYSVNNMLGGVSPLSIDAQTGLLTAVPTTIGNFVVGVCVKEYRNGVLVGETKRDFQFNVVDCQPQVVSSFFVPTVICNDSVQFANASQGASEFHWDFGVDTSQADTSDQLNPLYVYPDTGTYWISLVASDSTCKDTAIFPVTIGPDIFSDAGGDRQICRDDTISLSGNGNGAYSWSPGQYLSDTTIANPLAWPDSTMEFMLTINNGYCTISDTVLITVEDSLITAGFMPDTTSGCAPLTVTFTDTSNGGTTYWWDFGDGDTANTANPTHTFTVAGIYEVFFEITDFNTCNDKDTATGYITVIDDTSYALTNDTICNGQSVLIGLPADTNLTYAWSPATTLDDTTLANPRATPLAVGTSFYSLILSNGICTDTLQKEVEVIPAIELELDPDTTLCLGDSILIGVLDEGYNYQWTPSTGLDNDTISSPWALPLTTTGYILTVDNGFCLERDTVIITVNQLAGKAGNPGTICKGDSIPIGGPDEGFIYTWNPPAGLSDPNAAAPNASPDSTTLYILTVSDGFCLERDTIQITVLGGAKDHEPDVSICQGDSVSIGIAPDSSLTYQWWPVDSLSDPNIANPVAHPDSTTTYQLTLSKGICSDTIEQTVLVGPSLLFTPDATASNCNQQGVRIGITDEGNTYAWSPAEGLKDPNAPNTIATPDTTTTYILTVSNEFCSKQYDVTVEVQQVDLKAEFTADLEFSCEKTLMQVQNTSSGASHYEWLLSDGTQSTEQQPDFEFEELDELSIRLIAIDAIGCTDTFSLNQKNILELITPFIPNVFTPNNDGANDCLSFIDANLPENCFELKVYNRWGEKVFETADPLDCWDGMIKDIDKPANKGVYYYILNIRDLIATGYVELLR